MRQWKIFDSSGSHKIHSAFTPSMGGLSIFLGAVLTMVMGLSLSDWISMKYFFIALSLMFIIGLRDDILALSAKQKLYSQFLPLLILVYLDKTILQSTYGLMGDFLFPEWIAMAITIFVLLILTNAYNLIDGLDGLAGTIGGIILICLGVWFFEIGNIPLSLVSLTFSGSLLAFLYFNWQPSKIFMGDTGALMIGLLISYLTIKFININHTLAIGSAFKFNSSIGTAVCLLIIPIFDTSRVIIVRLRKFQSPFKADKNHVHHQFIQLGFSHAKSVLFIAAISIFFISIAVLLRRQPDWQLILVALTGCLGINYGLKRAQLKKIKNGTEN